MCVSTLSAEASTNDKCDWSFNLPLATVLVRKSFIKHELLAWGAVSFYDMTSNGNKILKSLR